MSKTIIDYNISTGIPPRCFECGRMISHLYLKYIELLKKKNISNNDNLLEYNYLTPNNRDIIEELGLGISYCCSTHLITHPPNLTSNL